MTKCAKCGINVEYALLDEPGVKVSYKGWYQPTDGKEKHWKGKRMTFCPACTIDLKQMLRRWMHEQ